MLLLLLLLLQDNEVCALRHCQQHLLCCSGRQGQGVNSATKADVRACGHTAAAAAAGKDKA
jgi:hypothetical protein